MKHLLKAKAIITVLISLLHHTEAETLVTVIPQGIESVNGSSVNMECTSRLVDSGGVIICDECSTNLLIDGCSPAIDTSTSDWASQLVTVRKTQTDEITFDHVPLTFGFDTAVSLTGIEMDLFLCPEWGIGAPFILAYFDEESNLVFSGQSLNPQTQGSTPSQSSCNSLSTVTISLRDALRDTPYLTVHVLISSFNSSIDWVHVGEVRFLGSDTSNTGLCGASGTPLFTPTETSTHPSISEPPTATTTNKIILSLIATDRTSISLGTMISSELSNIAMTTFITTMTTGTVSTTAKTPFTTMDTNSEPSTLTFTNTEISSEPPKTPFITTGIVHETYTNTETTSVPSVITKTTTEAISQPPMSTDIAKEPFIITIEYFTTASTTIKTKLNDGKTTIPQTIWISTAMVVVVFVLLLAMVLGLCFIKIMYKTRVKQKATRNQDYELRDISEEDSPPNANTSTPTLDISNSLYPRHANKAATPVGIYSEVDANRNETKIVSTQGMEFTGLYNVVTLVASNNVASETIESAAYATIESRDEQKKGTISEDEVAYAVPHALDNAPKIKPMSLQEAIDRNKQADCVTDTPGDVEDAAYSAVGAVQPQSKSKAPPEVIANEDYEEGPAEHLRVYTGIQVRQAPPVPTKSSDLELYLHTQIGLNAGTYSESINPLDFTRDRMQDDKNDPKYLAAVHPFSSELPMSGTGPTEVEGGNITEKMKLGTGQFGAVVLADTNDLSLKRMKLSKTDDNQNISIIVAVKKLKPNPSSSEKEAFNKEVNLTAHLKHPSILCLLGVCYQDPAFIMMEYTQEGDLCQFLQLHSEIVTSAPSSDDQITASELVYMASQIANGMQYLAKLNVVHRDLATRSCYVGTNSSIKVGDLGVNTTLYQSNYYRIRGNRLLPIRWMATECFSGKFSVKSDVWAFGVTMWELFTLGKEAPYPHLSDEEVIHNALRREHRQFPSKPVACPDHVYEIMENCFIVDLTQRAMFKKLHAMLQTEL